MTLAEILNEGGGAIHTIKADSSVMQAVKEMNRLNVGALLVTGEDRNSRGSSRNGT